MGHAAHSESTMWIPWESRTIVTFTVKHDEHVFPHTCYCLPACLLGRSIFVCVYCFIFFVNFIAPADGGGVDSDCAIEYPRLCTLLLYKGCCRYLYFNVIRWNALSWPWHTLYPRTHAHTHTRLIPLILFVVSYLFRKKCHSWFCAVETHLHVHTTEW